MKGRQPVPISSVKGHRTLAEKRARERKESELTSGSALQEWAEVRANKIAHNRFQKIKSLLGAIKKDDALVEPIVNRYCLIIAECSQLEKLREQLEKDIDLLGDHMAEMAFTDYVEKKQVFTNLILKCDNNIQSKRKMLLNIERENLGTIASILRSTTKAPDQDKPDENAGMFG